jgi:hypothetical protein
MPKGALLDTSFLITLVGRGRPHHETAKQYWKYFLENHIPLYLSSIVTSEFWVKQALPPEILRLCIPVPFNHDHAVKCAELYSSRLQGQPGQRDAIKDDLKLIAQAELVQAANLITDDDETMFKHCEGFKAAGAVSFQAIKLKDGFRKSFLNPGGQGELEDARSPAPEQPRAEGTSRTVEGG